MLFRSRATCPLCPGRKPWGEAVDHAAILHPPGYRFIPIHPHASPGIGLQSRAIHKAEGRGWHCVPVFPITRDHVAIPAMAAIKGGRPPFWLFCYKQSRLTDFDPWATPRFPLGHPEFSTGSPKVLVASPRRLCLPLANATYTAYIA